MDYFSKVIIAALCNKTISAKQTTSFYLEQVWKQTGLPHQVISDWGPQFTSYVMKEVWKKLKVIQSLSTAFYPQTDRETEWVNQEIKQFFRIFLGFFMGDPRVFLGNPHLYPWELMPVPMGTGFGGYGCRF